MQIADRISPGAMGNQSGSEKHAVLGWFISMQDVDLNFAVVSSRKIAWASGTAQRVFVEK